MQVDSVEAFLVSLPLAAPRIHKHGQIDQWQTVIVRMRSGDLVGWGEAAPGPAPLDQGEFAAGAFAALRDWMLPAVAGARIETANDLQERLSVFRGNRFAKAAIDLAWWDLEARRQEKPLHKLLDGRTDAVEVGPTFDQMERIEDLFQAMTRAVEAGFARICLKFRPGWDIQMLNLMRQEVPTHPVHIDCEGALHLEQMEMLCRLDDFSLAMVEQPLPADDLVGHAMVQEAIRTPLCLDEGVSTVEQAAVALELKSGRFFKIEPGRVGGLTPAMAIYEAAHEECTPCWVGILPQTAIGVRAALALATKPNFTYPADLIDGSLFAGAPLAPLALPTKDPADGKQKVAMWTEPGIGVEPDAKQLEQCTIAHAKCS